MRALSTETIQLPELCHIRLFNGESDGQIVHHGEKSRPAVKQRTTVAPKSYARRRG